MIRSALRILITDRDMSEVALALAGIGAFLGLLARLTGVWA